MDGEKESHLRFTFFMINMEMGDVIEFVDLLVLLGNGGRYWIRWLIGVVENWRQNPVDWHIQIIRYFPVQFLESIIDGHKKRQNVYSPSNKGIKDAKFN